MILYRYEAFIDVVFNPAGSRGSIAIHNLDRPRLGLAAPFLDSCSLVHLPVTRAGRHFASPKRHHLHSGIVLQGGQPLLRYCRLVAAVKVPSRRHFSCSSEVEGVPVHCY